MRMAFRDKFAPRSRNRLLLKFGPWMAGGVGLLVVRHYLVVGSIKESGSKMADNSVVVVTGANSGIGRQVAEKLAKKGASRLVLGCRDVAACKQARQEIIYATGVADISVRRLDLGDLSSVREFATSVRRSEPRVDVLVNAAGVLRDTHAKERCVTRDGFETHMGVNHLGPFLLTSLLAPALTQAPGGGRVLNVTCGAALKSSGALQFADFNYDAAPYDARTAYARSKRAFALSAVGLRAAHPELRVATVNPGAALTRIDRHMTWHQSLVSSAFLRPLRRVLVKSAAQASVPVVNCALPAGKETPDLMPDPGASVYVTAHGVREMPRELGDAEEARKLWLLSRKWTRLDEGEGGVITDPKERFDLGVERDITSSYMKE